MKKTFLFLAALAFTTIAYCQTADTVILKEALMLPLHGFDANRIIASDAMTALMETGRWKTPLENDLLTFNGKTVGSWKKINAPENGWFGVDSLTNAYVEAQYKSDKNEIVLLEAMGHGLVYVNGVAYSGNPYRTQDKYDFSGPRFDYWLLPVKVNKGNNELAFICNREGVLKIKIHRGAKGLYLVGPDITVPDIIVNQPVNMYGAIPVINATEETLTGLYVKTGIEGSNPEYYSVKQLNPLSIYKTPFLIKLPAQQNEGVINFIIEIIKKDDQGEKVLASKTIELNVVKPGDKHKETFISKLDNSVQYYAVTPPENLNCKPALFLSLHGAGVEAINQARAYNFKNWGYIVCPTNRRPYGYNWENWGRLDALEVYNIAMNKFNIDSNRVYLTGHSMGGHGTWQLGINYPDKFAAVGPGAGWVSIWSYRQRGATDSSDVRKMLLRSLKHSDTYSFATNLKQDGIYIIHGDADDNVPPQQAKSMIDVLSKFHKDYVYYEQPGAGHWWDNSDEPGADCVDWLPMFDFFAHHSTPDKYKIKTIDFATANPAITSSNYWIEILNQTEQQQMSKINIKVEPGNRKFIGTTSNIERLSIDASILPAGKPVTVNLDNQTLADVTIPADNKIYLYNEKGKWQLSVKQSEDKKYPGRLGNFREALNNNVVFVYGTNGNSEENKWAYNKTRFEAEKLWYQGNGSIEVIADKQFDADKYKDRNVVLFGNSKTNSAWSVLLKDSPVQVTNKKVKIGNKEFEGKDIACLFIRPRTDSKIASVAVLTGTGIEGMRLADLAQFSHPYVSFPDILVYNSGVLKSDDEGVKCAGYFGNNWSVESGDILIK